MIESIRTRKYRALTSANLDRIPQLDAFPQDELDAIKAVAAVLPFRVNDYVTDELIDWSRVPDDPIFRLTFPQAGMLAADDFTRMLDLVRRGAPGEAVKRAAREIQLRLNPHPGGQQQLNVPLVDGLPVQGMQHKYRETVLLFPAAGQSCHAYCTYCFRWAQFVGVDELKFAGRNAEVWTAYLKQHREVHSALITGGDPMIMSARVLRKTIEPLLAPELEHVETLRIGSKSLSYWPHRFVTDPDADDVLRLFEEVRAAGRHLAFMAHFSHPRQLETPMVQQALRRIQDTGAVVRCQAPLIRHVNDSADIWESMWRLQVRHGAVPYYMFVERDTGPRDYFEVPLSRALEIFNQAYRRQAGLGRTVRGPVMSASPGKVLVDGVTDIVGERYFVLQFLQARDPEWVGKPFFAHYDPEATWLDDLKSGPDGQPFFFEGQPGRTNGFAVSHAARAGRS